MAASPTRDTFAGSPKHEIVSALYPHTDGSGRVTVILLDAVNKRVLMEVVDANGARVETSGAVDLKVGALAEADTARGKEIMLREVKGQNASGATAYALFARSPSYAAKLGLTEPDFQAAGGGGQAQMYRLKSVDGDHLNCHTWDGVTEGVENVVIRKSFKLRNSITQATLDGVLTTYTYAAGVDSLNRIRTASAQGSTEAQIVLPRWLVNDEIIAISVPVAGGVSILIDRNGDGRAWAKKA
jgi:hypothetical protein